MEDDGLYDNIFTSFLADKNVTPKKTTPKKACLEDSKNHEAELENLRAENDRLQKNMLSLLATARNEVARKDMQCDEYRKKYDNLVFKRAKLALTKDSLYEVVSRINADKVFKEVSVQTDAVEYGSPEDLQSKKQPEAESLINKWRNMSDQKNDSNKRESRFSRSDVPTRTQGKTIVLCDDETRLSHFRYYGKRRNTLGSQAVDAHEWKPGNLIIKKVELKNTVEKPNCLQSSEDISVLCEVKKSGKGPNQQSKVIDQLFKMKNTASATEVVDLCEESSGADEHPCSKDNQSMCASGHVDSAFMSEDCSSFKPHSEESNDVSKLQHGRSEELQFPDIDVSCINPVVKETVSGMSDCMLKQSTPLDRRKGVPRKLRCKSTKPSIIKDGDVSQPRVKEKARKTEKIARKNKSNLKENVPKGFGSHSPSTNKLNVKFNFFKKNSLDEDANCVENQLQQYIFDQEITYAQNSGKSSNNETSQQETQSEATQSDGLQVTNIGEGKELQNISIITNPVMKENSMPFINDGITITLQKPRTYARNKSKTVSNQGGEVANNSGSDQVASTVVPKDICSITSINHDVVEFSVIRKRKGRPKQDENDLLRKAPEKSDLPPEYFSSNKELYYASTFKYLNHCLKLPDVDIFPTSGQGAPQPKRRKPKSSNADKLVNPSSCPNCRTLQESDVSTPIEASKVEANKSKQVPKTKKSSGGLPKVPCKLNQIRKKRKFNSLNQPQQTEFTNEDMVETIVDLPCGSNEQNYSQNTTISSVSETAVATPFSLTKTPGTGNMDQLNNCSESVSPAAIKSNSHVIILPRRRARKERKLSDSNDRCHHEIVMYCGEDSKQDYLEISTEPVDTAMSEDSLDLLAMSYNRTISPKLSDSESSLLNYLGQ